MVKLRPRNLFKTSSKANRCAKVGDGGGGCHCHEIEWELRPGGMLVQKRETGSSGENKEMIIVRVSTGSWWHDIVVVATATFGELKELVAMATGLAPLEQRLLFRGKEKEDGDHLHMVGVKEGDKVVLLEDPAFKEMKLRDNGIALQAMEIKCPNPNTVHV